MSDTKKEPDRRVERTRKVLFEALFGLMSERGYERLTVQNLLDRSGVGRATFYAHFTSKDELLACSVARLQAWLVEVWQAMPEQRLGFTLPLFQHLVSGRRIYQMTTLRDSEVSVDRHIRRMLQELVRQDLAARRTPGQSEASLDLATQYVVAALQSTIAWWMSSASPLPPEKINAVFQRLTFPGLDVTLAEAL